MFHAIKLLEEVAESPSYKADHIRGRIHRICQTKREGDSRATHQMPFACRPVFLYNRRGIPRLVSAFQEALQCQLMFYSRTQPCQSKGQHTTLCKAWHCQGSCWYRPDGRSHRSWWQEVCQQPIVIQVRVALVKNQKQCKKCNLSRAFCTETHSIDERLTLSYHTPTSAGDGLVLDLCHFVVSRCWVHLATQRRNLPRSKSARAPEQNTPHRAFGEC
jgi:hypothetical protein